MKSDDPAFETNMALDLDEIENRSLWLDLRIILKTLLAVLRAERMRLTADLSLRQEVRLRDGATLFIFCGAHST